MEQNQKPLSTGARLNIFLLRIARNWMRVVLVFIGVYAVLPWVAPVLMQTGAESAGRAIYTLYTPMCHQMAFRSFFLFGDQYAYPLAGSGTHLEPFEAYAGRSLILNDFADNRVPQPPFNVRGLPEFTGLNIGDDVQPTPGVLPEAANFARLQLANKPFNGNEIMGYKTALCERDLAIYAAIFFAGLIYSRPYVRRRVRPVPLLLYLFLGVLPIALDGGSQLLSYPPLELWPARETLPIFRVVTGALFGFMTAWLGFPYVEMSMQDTRREIEAKLIAAGIWTK